MLQAGLLLGFNRDTTYLNMSEIILKNQEQCYIVMNIHGGKS